jgi:hypothetical protein
MPKLFHHRIEFAGAIHNGSRYWVGKDFCANLKIIGIKESDRRETGQLSERSGSFGPGPPSFFAGCSRPL